MKNRYGSTDEVGVFEMHDDGMQVGGWAGPCFFYGGWVGRAA